MIPPTDAVPFLEALVRLSESIVSDCRGLDRIKRTLLDNPEIIDNPRSLDACFLESLGTEDWQWGWYDKWRGKFEETDVWPRTWHGGTVNKAKLLSHTMCFSARRQFKWGKVRFSPVMTDEPSEVQVIITAKIAAYAKANPGAGFPPFFPGDRTMARPYMETSRPSPVGYVVCSFHGFGEASLPD